MQPCSRALETSPICSGPGCVVRNSSKWDPWGLNTHTHTCTHAHTHTICLSICYIFVLSLGGEGEPGGKKLSPTLEGGACWDHRVNGIHAMTQWKWRIPGLFYAHVSIRLGLWQGGGAPATREGVCSETSQGCCRVFCLVSHPCAAKTESWALMGAASFLSHHFLFFVEDRLGQ